MHKHDVFVSKESRGGFRVRPAVVVKKKETVLSIKNFTDHTVTVSFPKGCTEPRQSVIDGGDESKVDVSSTPGVYSYKVQVAARGGLVTARGESAPKMIIDD
jgi:hypothetical protein